ncbi:ABC transporter ATP-binding protein [Sphingomonas sp. LR61]|uniref:ABC transporter ATP-binding protein n=1 Tax=Sphingomonas sp. LR61 TaxID=3050234 RepID=UPI002FE3E6D0
MVDLHAREVTVGYHGRDVVHAASLELTAGTVTALVGPNGSGKSTLLRTIARLQPARSGLVHLREYGEAADVVDGLAPTPKAFARQVALLTQGRPVPGGLRVRDLVAFGRHPYHGRFGGRDADGQAVVAHALEVSGLTSLAERPADELSGGQLQQVWLASCLGTADRDTPAR